MKPEFRLVVVYTRQRDHMLTETNRHLKGRTADYSKDNDPLGMLAPFTVQAKICFQQLWRMNLDWDSPLPHDLVEECSRWCDELYFLGELTVP